MATSTSDKSMQYESDESLSMKLTIKSMKLKWPHVQNIKTGDLHNRLDDCKESIVLLDTRPEEEYSVSHIAGAARVHPEATDVNETYARLINNLPENRNITVVCYCSVGYRSSKYAQTLQNKLDKEKTNDRVSLFNLEGSLFKWANEGRPMVDLQHAKTIMCHPYNAFWGKLLKSGLAHTTTK